MDYRNHGPSCIKYSPGLWQIQASLPNPVQWVSWSYRTGEPLLGMPLWHIEELTQGFVLSFPSIPKSTLVVISIFQISTTCEESANRCPLIARIIAHICKLLGEEGLYVAAKVIYFLSAPKANPNFSGRCPLAGTRVRKDATIGETFSVYILQSRGLQVRCIRIPGSTAHTNRYAFLGKKMRSRDCIPVCLSFFQFARRSTSISACPLIPSRFNLSVVVST